MDALVGPADRDRPVVAAAHHHTLEYRLAPVIVLSIGHPDGLSGRGTGAAITPLKPLDPSARVHQLLLTRIEGMARRAQLDMDLRLRGSGGERVAARTPDGGGHVLRMNALLHVGSFLALVNLLPSPSLAAR